MAKRGRKSKYDEYIKPRLADVRQWKKTGATDEQICRALNISKSSYYEYAKKYSEFSDAIKGGVAEFCFDLRGNLAKLAEKHKLETVKRYIKEDENGNKVITTEITEREVDADVAAINLLLKNLDSDNWANDPQNLSLRKQEIELRRKIAEANNFDLNLTGGV